VGKTFSIAQTLLALVGGAAVVVLLSAGTDIALDRTVLPGLAKGEVHAAIWLLVIAYRSLYGILGCAVAAWLAPNKPMSHALALGMFGLFANIAGTIVMWDVGAHWYPIALAILSIPCAWMGGILYLNRTADMA
jgi:hypothetical protein